MMMRLVQITDGRERRVAVVEEPRLRVIAGYASVYALAMAALDGGQTMGELAAMKADFLDYDEVYAGGGEWRLLVPLDYPEDVARTLVSGTGLTHLGSAKNRDAMHEAAASETDSMKMFRWGVEGGKPAAGRIGIAPEWFYKGTGAMLRAHGEALEIPAHGEDGGEEAEIAGLYVIDREGMPVRVGMAQGNEFSDHVFEKRNYLNLAGSKLRQCSIGPEVVIGADFGTVRGRVRIERAGGTVWEKAIATGEAEMSHGLANIEHHHFKFEGHRRPGDVHVHFYGACALSFGEGVKLAEGDVMEVGFEGFGRPLRNVLRAAGGEQALVSVRTLQ